MCLTKVTKHHDPPLHTDKPIIAYKCVDMLTTISSLETVPHLPWERLNHPSTGLRESRIPLNQWITAVAHEAYLRNNLDSYETGFHCFPTIKDALQYNWGDSIIKVEIKELFLEGMEYSDHYGLHNLPVILARQMFVAWPQAVVNKTDKSTWPTELLQSQNDTI